jgi:hypothetical protein
MGMTIAFGANSSAEVGTVRGELAGLITYLAGLTFLTEVATLRCHMSAWRAIRVDPMVALHYE